MTYVARTDKYRGKASVGSENVGDLIMQCLHIVAVALLTEFSEAAEILPYLGRSKAKLLTQLKGRDTAYAFVHQLIQLTQVSGQTADNIV